MSDIQETAQVVAFMAAKGLPTPRQAVIQAQKTYSIYLSKGSADYSYSPFIPSDLPRRKVQWIQQEVLRLAQLAPPAAPSTSGKPDTRAYYDSKHAVNKPADGDKAMRESDSCLTCISQGALCNGQSVMDGKCCGCRGYNAKGTKTKAFRVCRWREPQNNVYTYKQHMAFHDPPPPPTAPVINTPSEAVFRTIRDFRDDYTQELIRAMAAAVYDCGWVTADDRKNVIALSLLTNSQKTYGVAGHLEGEAALD